MNLFKDLSNEKICFGDGIKWLSVETYGSYLFKESFNYYSLEGGQYSQKHKKKSSLPEEFNIPSLCRKQENSLSMGKIKKNSYALFQTNTIGSMRTFYHGNRKISPTMNRSLKLLSYDLFLSQMIYSN